MKKITLISIFFVGLLSLVIIAPVFALDLGLEQVDEAGIKAGYGQATEFSMAERIGQVVQIASSLLGIIFTVLMVYAGFTWMLARGDDTKVEKAKDLIKAAIIGLIIVLAAYSISYFVTNALLKPSTAIEKTPTFGN